jgi:phospholipid transport system substrate-binding protein
MRQHPPRPSRLGIVPWTAALFGVGLAVPAIAADLTAEGFVQGQHRHIEGLLHQPRSQARDEQVGEALGQFVDFDTLTRRAFGEPCPSSEPSCEDLWAGYSDTQHAELRDLLERNVRKSYEKNLLKTLDYDVGYRGAREGAADTRVMTEAKNRLKPREPAVRVDYVVTQTPQGLRVVDIVTEGSSLTKNYYDQFRKKMHNAAEGYPNIVAKLRDKLAKP